MRHSRLHVIIIYLLPLQRVIAVELLTFVREAGFLARKLLCHPQNNEHLRMLCHPQSCVL